MADKHRLSLMDRAKNGDDVQIIVVTHKPMTPALRAVMAKGLQLLKETLDA